MYFSLPSLALLAGLASAQFPSMPTGLTVVTSNVDHNVTISYKQTTLCETTPGVRSFSGYVHLPRSSLYDMEVGFDIHTYFLYFEARNDPENAPLGIYLAGGPGESSAFVAMNGEGGPCYVNLDGNSTTLNPWSLNNYANMLYIDQPVSTGFSYTSLINGTYSAIEQVVKPLGVNVNETLSNTPIGGRGVYSDPSPWATTNTTLSTAQALWHFAEHWLTQFPEYRSNNKNIGVWGNSAGGMWAPAVGAQFDKKIKASDLGSSLREWTVDNVGVTNGIIDFGNSMPYYLEYARNNTYGSFLDETTYGTFKQQYAAEGGCADLVSVCKTLAEQGDPLERGTNETVNRVCNGASLACLPMFSVLSDFNASLVDLGGDPCPYYFPVHVFLNQEWTQQALGVPLNFTYTSQIVLNAFSFTPNATGTGGGVRTDKGNIEYLLDMEIKVALVYGDRDSRCPWNAAEGLALTANFTGREAFSRTGFDFIQTNNTYQGGAVRQTDNLSFSRVFQSGHGVNTYQPETVERIFYRTFQGQDVATGKENVSRGYLTKGPSSSFYMVNTTLPETPDTCMVLGSFQEQSFLSLLQTGPTNGTGDGKSKPTNGTEDGGSQTDDPKSSAFAVQAPLVRVSAVVLSLTGAFMYL
ncbi:alpha/beta-hydrolase [Thozetella sp. PMI_491]|nr:alpha/beta-hydrolase [Thozetella sp. PMI_491]